MGQLGLNALHPADQHIRDGTLPIKPKAEVPVNLSEGSVAIIIPNHLKIIELL